MYATVVKRLLFLTGNAGKLAEASHFFEPLGYQVEQFLVDGKVPIVVEPQSDSLKDVAIAPNQKVVLMPLEASNVIGALAGITEIAKETFGKKENEV